MLYKYGKRKRDLLGRYSLFSFVNKTIIPLALVGYEMIIANSALRASSTVYLTIIPRARYSIYSNDNIL